MHPKLSDRILDMKPSAAIEMANMGRALKAKGHQIISLSLGEPNFDTPTHIKEAAIQALHDGFTKYTPIPGLPLLREAIASKFKRDNGINYSMENIIVSNGAKQSIANVLACVLNPGDEIIIFTPYWVSYFEMVKVTGAIPVLLNAGVEQDFKVLPDQLKSAITSKTKAILFSSPCNPTGSVFSEFEMRALMHVIKDNEDIVVISDEIYEYVNFTGQHFSPASIDFLFNRTATINGFSKAFAMTGWRLGYLGGPKWLVDACTKMQSQHTSGAAAFNQVAGAHALNSDMGPTYKMIDAYKERRALVLEHLGNIPGLIINNPKGAFYAFPDISSFYGKQYNGRTINNSNEMAMFLLEEAHVATVAGSAFGDDNCIRLSYAASNEDLIEAIRRMKEYLGKLEM